MFKHKKVYEDNYVAKKYIRKLKNAKESGTEFALTLSQFKRIIMRKKCFYTDVVMNKPLGDNSKDWNDLTLDRIDNSKGYIPGNVVACTKAANNLKAIWENPEFDISVEQAHKLTKRTIKQLNLIKENK